MINCMIQASITGETDANRAIGMRAGIEGYGANLNIGYCMSVAQTVEKQNADHETQSVSLCEV